MACTRDLQMFTGCIVVRVGTPQWNQRHNRILDALLDKVRSFLSERQDMSFEQLIHDFESHDVRALVGDRYAHILYGTKPLFVNNDGCLNTEIKGLLFKPRARMIEDGRLVVEL